MGLGDEIIATSFARGAWARGKKIAFGDGKRWVNSPWQEIIFRNNPNIASPSEIHEPYIEWCNFCKGHRFYNRLKADRWEWNFNFRVTPGEIVFDAAELRERPKLTGYVVVEPNLPWHKSVAINKDWGEHNWRELAERLVGVELVQFEYGHTMRRRLAGVRFIATPTFRQAMAVLARARFAILPEGGLHHAAAALGVPAIVLFGGFIPPAVVGYPGHVNLTGNVTSWCGSLQRCQHCADAMAAITVDQVYQRAIEWLVGKNTPPAPD